MMCTSRTVLAPLVMLGLAGTVVLAAQQAHDDPPLDIRVIERAAETEATATEDGVIRIGWSRDDVAVEIDGMPFKPQAGLGSWAAFMPMSRGRAMVMGDTVVFEDEITGAMDAAFEHGLDVTALHNHFIFDRPPVFFMHIGGVGDPAELAVGVHAMWDAIRDIRRRHPKPRGRFSGAMPDQTGQFDVPALEEILGTPGTLNNGVVKFTVGRTARMHDREFGASMGLTTWAAFSGSQEAAVVDGDFAMTAEEVQPVMRALRQADIHIVALHNHMIGEQPAYYFLHYWGKGAAANLAQGLRNALNTQTPMH